MAGKWQISELRIGQVMETSFWTNPVKESRFRFRATHLDGRRAPKVVLCDDARIQTGQRCQVRIQRVTKPERDDHGSIEVAFVRGLDFKLEGIYLDPMTRRKLQVLLESGLNILLDGPQGCGKTVLARTLAQSLGFEFVFFNCGAVVEASDFLATVQVRAGEGGQPVMDFIKTEVLRALETALTEPRRRFLVFLDELNRCQESARNALMPALDSTRRIFDPVTNRFLEIPDNVQFIAALNRGDEFSATFGLDPAQLDRFAPLKMDYLPPEKEVELLAGRHPELPASLLKLIVDTADAVRRSPDIATGLSVRATEEACLYLKHPLFIDNQRQFLAEVLQSSFCGRFSGDHQDPGCDAGAVWALIEARLKKED